MAITGIALSLVTTTAVVGAGGSRQTSATEFDQRDPARSTGTTLSIEYVNPSDPAAKPYAVQRTVTEFAPGTVIDTSVPQRCTASDPQLVSQGAGACPEGSRVGSGGVVLDTGLSNGRDLENDVTLLNNKDELILLIEPKGGGPRFVTRAAVSGRRIISDVPPLPGGPPDGFTAVKRVRLHTRALTHAGRNYSTTPSTCTSGGWVNSTAFTYRDGVTQTVSNRSPCMPPLDRVPPNIELRGVKRNGCVRRAFVVHVRVNDTGSGVEWTKLSLDNRRLLKTKRALFSWHIRTRQLRRGRQHRITAIAQDHAGNRALVSRSFAVCKRRASNRTSDENGIDDRDRERG